MMKKTRPTISRAVNIFAGMMASIVSFDFSFAQGDGEELTKKALELFEKRCQECHHPDTEDEIPYLHKASDIAELLEEDGGIVAGKPEDSTIFKRVILEKTSRKRMPKSKGAPGDEMWREPLTDDEKQLLEDWIVALKEGTPPTPVTTAVKDTKLPQPKKETVAQASVSEDALPEGDLETQARFILNEHCQKCHNPEERKSPDLRLSLAELLNNGDANSILERVTLASDDDDRMPPDPERVLNSKEIDVLKKWVNSNVDEREKRDPLYFSDALRFIYEDVLRDENASRYYRYLTLTNLHNVTDAEGFALYSKRDMDTFRSGVSKLMNSLSLHGKVTPPTPLDPAQTIYRVDLRDYKWSHEDWERVVGYYPHGILGIDGQKERVIHSRTGSNMAYLRADWFVFAASQPPLYDDILDYLLGIYTEGDDGVQQRLEHRLAVDRVENLKLGNAVRAGFLNSGVSDHNRLIERHESTYGSYWVSYDFKRLGASNAQDLRKAPLGPNEAHLAKSPAYIFDHDGGEMIYSLPNGLQAYLLATADGRRLDRAPSDIVRDSNRADGTIINGISCIKCHNNGMKGAIEVPLNLAAGETAWDEKKMGEPSPRTPAGMTDEIRPFVEKSQILGGAEFGLLRKLYPEKEELRRVVMLDYERFNAANDVATLGVKSAIEPVSFLYDAYFKDPVTARHLAAEFGMSYDEMMKLIEEESFQSDSLRTIYQSLDNGGAEPRDQVMLEYLTITYVLGYHMLPFEPLGYEEFGGEDYADLIRNSHAFVSIFGGGNVSGVVDYAKLQQGSSQVKTEMTQSAGASKDSSTTTALLPGGGKLTVSVESAIHIGQNGHLIIESTEDIYLRVLHNGAGVGVTQFFPNANLKNDFMKANTRREITFGTSPPHGAEYFEVYASSSPIKIAAQGQAAGEFQVFKRGDLFSARGLATAVQSVDTSIAGRKAPAKITKAKVGYVLKK